MKKQGNCEAMKTMRGQSLVYLALFCVVYPAATINRARAYFFNMDPMVGVPFRTAAVVDAEHLLGLKRNASSTTCMRANWTIDMHKR